MAEAVRKSRAELVNAKKKTTTFVSEDKEVSEMLFTINPQGGLISINAFDMDGLLVPRFSINILCCDHFPELMGFTAVNSILYIFGGASSVLEARYAYALDIHQIPLLARDHNISDMDITHRRLSMMMKGYKVAPSLYVVDSKIYVLSNRFYPFGCNIDFELLDIKTESFTALPNPHFPNFEYGILQVKSEALVDNKFIVVSVRSFKNEVFVFNIETSSWQTHTTQSPHPLFTFDPLSVPRKVIFRGTKHDELGTSSSTPLDICNYYAFTPCRSSLVLYKNFSDLHSVASLEIAPALPCVCYKTRYHIAAVDDVIFIIRLGSSLPYNVDSYIPPKIHMTIDKYRMSGEGELIVRDFLVKENCLMLEPLLYTIPLKLRQSNLDSLGDI